MMMQPEPVLFNIAVPPLVPCEASEMISIEATSHPPRVLVDDHDLQVFLVGLAVRAEGGEEVG